MNMRSENHTKLPAEAEVVVWMELPSGHRVRARITVFEEPLFPTPNEKEISRVPLITEWARIVAKLAHLDFTRMES